MEGKLQYSLWLFPEGEEEEEEKKEEQEEKVEVLIQVNGKGPHLPHCSPSPAGVPGVPGERASLITS